MNHEPGSFIGQIAKRIIYRSPEKNRKIITLTAGRYKAKIILYA